MRFTALVPAAILITIASHGCAAPVHNGDLEGSQSINWATVADVAQKAAGTTFSGISLGSNAYIFVKKYLDKLHNHTSAANSTSDNSSTHDKRSLGLGPRTALVYEPLPAPVQRRTLNWRHLFLESREPGSATNLAPVGTTKLASEFAASPTHKEKVNQEDENPPHTAPNSLNAVVSANVARWPIRHSQGDAEFAEERAAVTRRTDDQEDESIDWHKVGHYAEKIAEGALTVAPLVLRDGGMDELD